MTQTVMMANTAMVLNRAMQMASVKAQAVHVETVTCALKSQTRALLLLGTLVLLLQQTIILVKYHGISRGTLIRRLSFRVLDILLQILHNLS